MSTVPIARIKLAIALSSLYACTRSCAASAKGKKLGCRTQAVKMKAKYEAATSKQIKRNANLLCRRYLGSTHALAKNYKSTIGGETIHTYFGTISVNRTQNHMGAFLTVQTVTCQTKSAMIHANPSRRPPFYVGGVMLTTTQPPTISPVPVSLDNEIPVTK
ncbi:hypothetical protein [Brevibacillus laterosporus]|uniref:Uncharacterized protein n=1 Tax=Brevibacillus laterosporus TaxID=1465 RepID=A0A0F7EFY7_BRELA|nr:hypothetical protein EX87_06955 [Brevibacillus laterosporus]